LLDDELQRVLFRHILQYLNKGGYIGYIILFLKLKKKRELGRPKYMLVDNIKTDHKGVGHEASQIGFM
jgi:hypothetical protein